MKISIASDHAGYALRHYVADRLREAGHTLIEHGAQSEQEAFSYVTASKAAAKDVASRKAECGIVFCGTGIGASIVANKVPGIRCALCTNAYMAKMARQHNNANVLALGGRVLGSALAMAIVAAFLSEPFENGGRHQVRVTDIDAMDR